MARWFLQRLAVVILLGGAAAAAFMPSRTLDLCSAVRVLDCTATNLHFLRIILGVGAAMVALLIWQIGSLSRH